HQLADARLPVALDGGRASLGRGNDLAVDDENPQVTSGHERFQQHVRAVRPGPLDRRRQLSFRLDANGDPAALLAAGRLDDQWPMPIQELLVLVVKRGAAPRGNREVSLLEQSARDAL